jgi:hypothetical protein
MGASRPERSEMYLRPILAALFAVAALGLAACGGGEEEAPASSSSSSSSSEDEQRREAGVKFAQCMREQGVDIPDPGTDGRQRIQIGPDSGISPDEFERASKECEEYRQQMMPELSEEEQEEFRQKALEWARCMRENGIDVPDPQVGENGGMRITGGQGRTDPEDPEFQAAQEKCGEPGLRRRP